MGATKRFAELYIQSLTGVCRPTDSTPRTRFVAVRFGNVLGSSGSVVPIFERQIDAGGPVTVTHAEMRRFFMTIPEASQLVMQAGAIGKGGEIFVLDMGEPIRILDLATMMIRRRGLEPDRDIAIRFTGIRPGEKLYEELAKDDEQTKPTSHAKIRVWQLATADARVIATQLKLLSDATTKDREAAIAVLSQCVPEYHADLAAIESDRVKPALRLVTEAA
jgi:FlaA1/EpsC-like NDP-sugar epimerase